MASVSPSCDRGEDTPGFRLAASGQGQVQSRRSMGCTPDPGLEGWGPCCRGLKSFWGETSVAPLRRVRGRGPSVWPTAWVLSPPNAWCASPVVRVQAGMNSILGPRGLLPRVEWPLWQGLGVVCTPTRHVCADSPHDVGCRDSCHAILHQTTCHGGLAVYQHTHPNSLWGWYICMSCAVL